VEAIDPNDLTESPAIGVVTHARKSPAAVPELRCGRWATATAPGSVETAARLSLVSSGGLLSRTKRGMPSIASAASGDSCLATLTGCVLTARPLLSGRLAARLTVDVAVVVGDR
jgi:hypothetical protein